MPSAAKHYSGQIGSISPTETQRFVTRNSEYMVRCGICVEVRRRKGSEVLRNHGAVDQQIVAHVRWRRAGGQEVMFDGKPEIGDSLLLGGSGPQIMTSAVRHIDVLGANDGPI